ncbi:MAG TPA: methyltransferase domain-containing protein [Candidatus Limnocylindria bacterium]
MSACCDPSGYHKQFGERTARRNADAYRKRGLDGTARGLVARLRDRGVAGATVLEVGGGVGGIQLELLRAGASRATNVELSPEYETSAEALAAEAGLTDRVERRIGDFVEVAPTIPPADIVVMHRVVCCYPYLERLLAPAAERTRSALALTFPRATPWIRAALRVGNAWFAMTRCSFRAFVHPPAEIERIAVAHGLRPAYRHRGFVWQTVVYERAEAVTRRT